MPLSKARNRDRMRQIRLHAKTDTALVQPNALHPPELDGLYRGNYGGRDYEPEYIDADGSPVYEE